MSNAMGSPTTKVKRFFWRYHLLMFITIAATGTGLAIYSLLGIANQSSGTVGSSQTGQAAVFDQATIKRVQQLSNTPNYTVPLPTNQRNNPFTE